MALYRGYESSERWYERQLEETRAEEDAERRFRFRTDLPSPAPLPAAPPQRIRSLVEMERGRWESAGVTEPGFTSGGTTCDECYDAETKAVYIVGDFRLCRHCAHWPNAPE